MRLLPLICVAGLTSAQAPPAQNDGQAPFKIVTKYVLAPVSVTDKSGEPVNGLTPDDFELLDNGHLQKITEDVASHPLSLVLVIQASSSVELFIPKLQRLGNMIQAQLLGDSGEVAVLEFDHRIQTLLPFTSDPDKLGPTMKKLHAGSTTDVVNDAVMQAINMLRDRPSTRRRVVIVVAENKNGGSEISVREVMSAADFAQVTIYPIDISKAISELTKTPLPNRPNPIPPEGRPITNGIIQTPTTDSQTDVGNWVPLLKDVFDMAKSVFVPNPLTVYAKYTGGHQYSFVSQKELERAIDSISETLHSEYMLTYNPNDQNEAGFHQIVVRVKHRDLKIVTRDGYYLAGKPL